MCPWTVRQKVFQRKRYVFQAVLSSGCRYSLKGLAICAQCPQGYFQGGRAKANCATCPIGYSTSNSANVNGIGASQCTLCATGKYSTETLGIGGDTLAQACVICPTGKYQNQQGQSVCRLCLVGFTSYIAGAMNPNQCKRSCPTGEHSTTQGTIIQPAIIH